MEGLLESRLHGFCYVEFPKHKEEAVEYGSPFFSMDSVVAMDFVFRRGDSGQVLAIPIKHP